jgi:hypothetical protein
VWIITAWQHISPELTVCCICNALEGTDDNIIWNGGEEDENVGSVRKMKAMTVKESDLIGKGGYILTCFVHIAHAINSKIFFLADISFWQGGGVI